MGRTLQEIELWEAGLYLWARVAAGGAVGTEAPMVLRMGCQKLRELAVTRRREGNDLLLDGDLLEAGGVGFWDDEPTLVAMLEVMSFSSSGVDSWKLTRGDGQAYFEFNIPRGSLPRTLPEWLTGSCWLSCPLLYVTVRYCPLMSVNVRLLSVYCPLLSVTVLVRYCPTVRYCPLLTGRRRERGAERWCSVPAAGSTTS